MTQAAATMIIGSKTAQQTKLIGLLTIKSTNRISDCCRRLVVVVELCYLGATQKDINNGRALTQEKAPFLAQLCTICAQEISTFGHHYAASLVPIPISIHITTLLKPHTLMHDGVVAASAAVGQVRN